MAAADFNKIANETARVVRNRIYVSGELKMRGDAVDASTAVVRIPDQMIYESSNSCYSHGYLEVEGSWLQYRNNAQVYQQSAIRVVNADALEIAAELQRDGYNPAVCMPSDPRKAGGGYMNGSTNMESEVYRRTNMAMLTAARQPFQHIEGSSYMKTILLRYPRDQGWKFHREPTLLSIVATPSISCYPGTHPKDLEKKLFAKQAGREEPCRTVDDGKLRFNNRYRMKVIRRLQHSLQLALLYGHDSVVLTAAGCGANGNPPFETARAFRDAIEPYRKYFKQIVFAIIDDSNALRNSSAGNYRPFKLVFEDQKSLAVTL